MRTTKPISTISFNTPEYLYQKLKELENAGLITFWSFICHEPEDDEGGKKQHQHVYIEPSKMIQTDNIREELKEFDPQNPDKPRGCLKFSSSKFGDWYMYGLHDKRYLASKGQSRKYHYSPDMMIASNADDLTFMARTIDLLSLSPYADMEEAQKQGLDFAQYFRRGTIPLPQVALFERAWYLLMNNATDRGSYKPHDMDIKGD